MIWLATVDAADVFDVAARHRLAVGDDRQRLEHGARVLGRLLGVQAVEVSRASPGGSGSASRWRRATSSTPRPVAFVGRARRAASRSVSVPISSANSARSSRSGSGWLRADQRGFEDALGIQGIHVVVKSSAASPGSGSRRASSGDAAAFGGQAPAGGSSAPLGCGHVSMVSSSASGGQSRGAHGPLRIERRMRADCTGDAGRRREASARSPPTICAQAVREVGRRRRVEAPAARP